MVGTPTLLGLPLEYAVFAGIFLLFIGFAFIIQQQSGQNKYRKQAKRIEKRVKLKHEADEATAEKNKSLRKAEGDESLPLLTLLLNKSRIAGSLRNRIAQAGLEITAERYLVYNGLLFSAAMLVVLVLFGRGFVLALLMGVILGFGLPHFMLNIAINRRIKAFLILFPDAIDLIVRGLRAGLPVTESIKMVAREIGSPVNNVFQTMTEKMALGVPLEKTLYETAAKYRITEFDFFVTSVVLQRETGGNLSEILNNLSEALRQRLMMRLKIKAMSSEARASMYIIGALPFVVLLALQFTSPEYLLPLFNDFRGNIAAAVAAGMLASGVFIMSRMAKFEI